MKRAIGAFIANWLRKPENRRKAKQAAQHVWSRFQQGKGTAAKNSRTPPRHQR
ncbi:hypothetical protein GCM10010082_05510 [Kushneria pakistanensis]|uniref:Uncharacterized protein n=1 Tax=Kushneria pakistanensis TaxID=1508770 RepID=A0ABQ3FC53_9GAMM|nr:hypothetical protein [Kushneria pakistanensis]GHC17298.1 hypothetical protein GCM10010082_05510 [Kushneria pakistanensis]